DAEGRLPVAEQVAADFAACSACSQDQGNEQLEKDGCKRNAGGQASCGADGQAFGAALEQQQRRTGEQRNDDRRDDQVGAVHTPFEPPPSTWSEPVSRCVRSAITSIRAVIAKPMTIAVSTSACGSGSA